MKGLQILLRDSYKINDTLDKEIHDLLTSALAMTNLKISQAEAHRSCCTTNAYRK